MKHLMLFALTAGIIACQHSALNIPVSNATVELDVFSGRENPRWQLTPLEASQLEERLSGLPAAGDVEVPSQLGYRGFSIRIENHDTDLITVTNNGYVLVHDKSGDRFYRDTRGVEAWLAEQASARGYGKLLTRSK